MAVLNDFLKNVHKYLTETNLLQLNDKNEKTLNKGETFY